MYIPNRVLIAPRITYIKLIWIGYPSVIFPMVYNINIKIYLERVLSEVLYLYLLQLFKNSIIKK
jgi:hypothetical protein